MPPTKEDVRNKDTDYEGGDFSLWETVVSSLNEDTRSIVIDSRMPSRRSSRIEGFDESHVTEVKPHFQCDSGLDNSDEDKTPQDFDDGKSLCKLSFIISVLYMTSQVFVSVSLILFTLLYFIDVFIITAIK